MVQAQLYAQVQTKMDFEPFYLLRVLTHSQQDSADILQAQKYDSVRPSGVINISINGRFRYFAKS